MNGNITFFPIHKGDGHKLKNVRIRIEDFGTGSDQAEEM
jgi:hypothetical protein